MKLASWLRPNSESKPWNGGMPTIQVSRETFERLQAIASPFVDSPDSVIARLLDAYEKQIGKSGRKRGKRSGGGKMRKRANNWRTRNPEFFGPLVKVLREAGGALETGAAVDRVGELMGDRLTEADHKAIGSGEIRWRNTVRFARKDLVGEGVLEKGSSPGTWELRDEFVSPTEEAHFPWKDVHASENDTKLQQEHPVEKGQGMYGSRARVCPGCRTPARYLRWVYFRSPDETWANLCGRAGWLTICEWCEMQVDFFCEEMN